LSIPIAIAIGLSIIDSFGSLGLSLIILGSPSSIPKAKAGKLSVTKFNQSNCIGNNGTGRFINILPNTNNISPILQDNKKNINFFILLYIIRPSSTADTILEKLSSVNTISAVFLATSVPVMPIAIPISDLFNAMASLTPSPVIATTSPLSFKADTILTLCSGDTLAYTVFSFTTSFNSSSFNSSISSPIIVSSMLLAISNSLAIAKAVSL